ncbi:nesprin-3 isoform X2 [Lampris incognitus]|uniref:nesprin-3 isoform X2 n=1 Tax=Lampris incognitus TaxID=2546036 RepID=UPI0024B4BA39|nr:nesprin-3 isoform X2 [Lampris incognitus]
MTQQEQQEFTESLEAALSWMQAVQERLRANDNTQGPRDALEARLRETEKIHESEHEGKVKMDVVLVAAEVLLQSGDDELRSHVHSRLKDVKAKWEETCTYIIHCHSRIEWVWLHWSEYLKAYEEFELWLARLKRSLDADVELQLGVKEKLWQVDHQRVVLSDVHGQAALLERLLDEAAALHNRTLDPSVEPQAQERLQEAYNDIRDRTEERLTLLQKIAEEHQMYRGCVHRFQAWLLSKTKELADLMEKENTSEEKLNAFRALDDSVASEEKTLLHIEGVAEAVRANTSPAGAETVVEEAEELRLGWQRLRQGLCEAEEGLRASLDSHSLYLGRCRHLGEDISRLHLLLQGLGQELEEGREAGDRADWTEEQVEGQWRKYMNVRNTLAAEETQVEHLKVQLKELFRFSEDSRHLSDDVLAVVKEHQSVKCRATRLCTDSELGLRQIFQDPLHVFSQWSDMAASVLEASAEVTEFSHVAMLVHNIEKLLKHSVQLQERLSLLQVKRDLMASVFGAEWSDGLLAELSAAVRTRDLLHTQLLQRKNRLQGLISRTKDFGDAYETVRSKLTVLRDRMVAADVLQPDILAKKSQSDQLRVIQKDLEDCDAHITALETLVSSSPSNRTQFERLCADWRLLNKRVRVKVKESEESIAEHENFHESLLNVEKWLMIMRQKLESYRSPAGRWSVENRQHEAERALGEFPEKELQLHQTEAMGQAVLEKTSEEGQVHILHDMRRLRESWLALHSLSLNLYRLLNNSSEELDSDPWSRSKPEALPGEGDSQVLGGGFMDLDEAGAYESPATGGGRGLEVEGPMAVTISPTMRLQDHSESSSGGQLDPGERDTEHVGLSPLRTAKESTLSFGFDEVDLSPWGLGHHQTKGRKSNDHHGGLLEDAAGGRSPKRSGLGGGSAGGVAAVTTEPTVTAEMDHSQGSGISLQQGIAEMEVSDGGEGLSHGGGAFMLFRKDSAKEQGAPKGGPLGETAVQGSSQPTSVNQRSSSAGSPGPALSASEYEASWREFKAWLCRENELLSGVVGTKGATLGAEELKSRQDTLKALRARVGLGQEQFQLLFQGCRGAGRGAGRAAAGSIEARVVDDSGLEDLRYRWMLYKSKLKDVGDLRARLNVKGSQARKNQSAVTKKVQKVPKGPGLLHRVCRVALPLWFLLLALLLLAFLLPFMDEGSSCSLSNNFARSFNIMLRYNGPPPT